MAKLSRLIRGQDVAFDTHQAGDGQEVHWPDLHLEKRLHKGGKIRFPFFGDRDPTWSENISESAYHRVIREVRRALERNSALADSLAETVVAQIARFRNGTVTIAQAQEAARKIADAFDLGEEFVASATVHANARLSRFATLHPGPTAGTVLEIIQSSDGVVVQKPKESWPRWKRDAL